MLRVLFRCWFYDLSCHRSKGVTKFLVITAVFGELSHRLSQVETIVAMMIGKYISYSILSHRLS